MATLWKPWGTSRSRFGDVVLVVFLLVQFLDGLLTYLGIITFGPTVEGNPLIAGMIATFGHAEGLLTAKILASTLGAALHLWRVHGMIAVLTLLYLVAAIVPWSALLFV